jgi:hypothetical protein
LEFAKKPPCTYTSKEKEKGELYSCRESFGSSDFFDVEKIIDYTNTPNRKKCKESEIGFISIPERISDSQSEF